MAPSSSSSASSASRGRGKGFALVAAVYLLGLFIGALDTGIVTPARTVIQSDLGIGEQMGDRKSTRLNSSHSRASRMPSSA